MTISLSSRLLTCSSSIHWTSRSIVSRLLLASITIGGQKVRRRQRFSRPRRAWERPRRSSGHCISCFGRTARSQGAIVYPSRALLQDQLGRLLKHIHDIKTDHGDQLSVGCYVGGMPWKRDEVGSKGFFESEGAAPDSRSVTAGAATRNPTHSNSTGRASRTFSNAKAISHMGLLTKI